MQSVGTVLAVSIYFNTNWIRIIFNNILKGQILAYIFTEFGISGL